MKIIVSLLLLIGFSYNNQSLANDGTYHIANIPASLKENANAVQRMEEWTFTIESPAEAIFKIRYAVTILNEKSKKYASIHVGYDKLTKFNYLQGALYDAQGKLIERLKKSDIEDISGVSDNSLFDDNRMKKASFNCKQYPCTVEFEYETTWKNMLFYPTWTPQGTPYYAVEKSSFTVIIPKSQVLRFKEVNLTTKPSITSTGDNQVYTWSIENLKAVEPEPLAPPLASLLPKVYTAPSTFEVEGYQGNMDSWQSFGKWLYDLNKNRDELPEETRQQVLKLVAGEKDPIIKTRKIYEFLQKNTRYVSIQLGIGGWQTFEANTVALKGYGDCKALSNYTKALLKVAGIESYCASIFADDDVLDIRTDFPSNQFNHVILCVPLVKDTIWLECTSQTNSFGYLGSSTSSRHALLFTPQGGKLIKTPTYTAKDNLQNRTIDVKINAEGDATAQVTTFYTGLQQEKASAVMNQLNPEDQKKYLYNHINLPSFEINKYEFAQQKERVPVVTEKLSLTVRKCVSKSGTRMFLTPNLLSSGAYNLPVKESRITDIIRKIDYIDTDTVRYHLPAGYHAEFTPENLHFKSVFGEYSASVQISDGMVLYIRQIKMNKGKYPAASYKEFTEFFKKIAKADKMQLVFVNKS